MKNQANHKACGYILLTLIVLLGIVCCIHFFWKYLPF